MDIGGINSAYADYAAKTAVGDSASKLQDNLKGGKAETDQELMDACKQFEAYMLEQVFKEMQKTVIKADESPDANAGLVDYFKDSTLVEISKQSTDLQGLGLAQSLYEQMKRTMAGRFRHSGVILTVLSIAILTMVIRYAI